MPLDVTKRVADPTEIVFDFNEYDYLRDTYNNLPEHIQQKLDKYVINREK